MIKTRSALLTDFYQFTMAYGYWQSGRAEQESVFQLTFRKNPFQNNYTIACGLANAIEFLQNYHFTNEDIEYLSSLSGSDKKPAFSKDFLKYLRNLKFSCDIDAPEEGSLMFPQEPLMRIRGPLLQCQLIETPLLNFLNFSSLVATRAAQITHIAGDDPVVEFGLRRAQGPNGGMMATRAAYIGGCVSTSNVLAGKEFNIPVAGTVAHSWVLSFPDELTAFREFVKTCPTTILVVDTYNTLQGVQNAITVGKELRAAGRDLMAVRLDSGDLLELSKKTRELLNAAGFTNTKILASGDLNVEKIAALKKHHAPIDIWGVGTRLITAYEQPSLDAIYKLSALLDSKGEWEDKMKFSDTPEKATLPGILQVRRFYDHQKFVEDVIFDVRYGLTNELKYKDYKDLLVPIFKQGKLVYQSPDIATIQQYCREQVKQFVSNKKLAFPICIDKKITDVITNNSLAHNAISNSQCSS